ncbi:MAG TPA: hypothetical protein VGX78_11310, partial [Pirellulales bacterium]|nr:hypothetical protein [Pirellulales bacterium]
SFCASSFRSLTAVWLGVPGQHHASTRLKAAGAGDGSQVGKTRSDVATAKRPLEIGDTFRRDLRVTDTEERQLLQFPEMDQTGVRNSRRADGQNSQIRKLLQRPLTEITIDRRITARKFFCQ